MKPQGTTPQYLALKEEDHSSLYITSCSRISRKKGGKTNQIPIKQVDTNINQLDGMLSRQEDNQVIPGWKGFFYEVTRETHIADTHIVGYLPTICQSPTKMDIVLEKLRQCKQKAEVLNLSKMDLILYHAIYAKAVELVMNEKFTDPRTFIKIRMGEFS